MLVLKDIVKNYVSGEETVHALDGINLKFRKSEFVSILGPSGCGKTTMLNIIGGLDQYTSGDLIVNGISTKKFDDKDWDSYRNHSVGFVFQNYNLIPHQSVISNVELALTLSGVTPSERKKRALDALERVGLKNQVNKKPNQMSGGQMQRVAIARALVNNPEILLADEPTGALDTETSVQVMEILHEISKDRLVIMVTHNPELAEKYSSRIIKVIDGKIIDDSNPYEGDVAEVGVKTVSDKKELKKPSMSFLTALSLSLNNLMTKKTRTLLTSFAGSIGIIGIALILSVSSGVNKYIADVQEDTLTSYPITIQSESNDMMSMLGSMMENTGGAPDEHQDGYIYSKDVLYSMMDSFTQTETNNLTRFKEYIESSDEFNKYVSAIQYGYDAGVNIYTKDPNDKIIQCDMNKLMSTMGSDMGMSDELSSIYTSSTFTSSMGSVDVWEEMLPGENGELIGQTVYDQYDIVYGEWPQSYDEAVLIVNKNNEISDFVLYTLGLLPYDDMISLMDSALKGEEAEVVSDMSWTYEDICNLEFKLILSSDKYQKQEDGTYIDLTSTDAGLSYLYDNSELSSTIKISGIVKMNEDAMSMMGSSIGSIGYTSALTDYIIKSDHDSDVVQEQLNDKETDVITGLPFKSDEDKELTENEKAERIKEYLGTLDDVSRSKVYVSIMSTATSEYINGIIDQYISSGTRDEIEAMMVQSYAGEMGVTDTESIKSYFNNMSDDEFMQFFRENASKTIAEKYAEETKNQLNGLSDTEIIALFESQQYSDGDYATFYDVYMPAEYSESTFEDNLKLLGYINEATPSSISIYVDSFNNKDKISSLIDEYNDGASDEDQIKYTDYLELMMSSISTVINAISYVLVAFVAISLVVSSIMIGIITYISVLERTKEIGILRSIGASKRDISRVFNAETLIVGLVAGLIGILITLLLIIPINAIIHHLTGIPALSAALPFVGGAVLVGISMLLTFIAGLIPSKIAAKKDPVVALRTE